MVHHVLSSESCFKKKLPTIINSSLAIASVIKVMFYKTDPGIAERLLFAGTGLYSSRRHKCCFDARPRRTSISFLKMKLFPDFGRMPESWAYARFSSPKQESNREPRTQISI